MDMNMAYDYDKERREVIVAGERALNSLEHAMDALNSAKGWGIYDMLGGGFISTLIKHSKMDKAANYIEAAKKDLEIFSRELVDIRENLNVDLNNDNFLGFADWFFDGFVADWLVQDKINDARAQVKQAIGRVNSILDRLDY